VDLRAADEPPAKPRLAVLDFKVAGKVDASGSQAAAALVRREINASGKYDLMDREMMRERMAEKDFAAIVECDQVKCLVQYGKSLDVQKIVGGSLASFGDSWLVEIRLVDVNTGREEKTFARKYTGKMDDVLDIVVDGARELIGLPTSRPAERRDSQRPGDLSKTATLDLGGGVKMDLVLIAAGTFTMGSNDGDSDESPPHEVRISQAFYMGKYEVTQGQWEAVMGNNPSWFSTGGAGKDKVGGADTSNHPVESVSWDDCQEFCKKLSARTGKAVRLPTEAEWEYACRAGTTTAFYFGETISTDQANYDGNYTYVSAWAARRSASETDQANYDRNYTYGNGRKGQYRQKTTPVGSFPANTWGLYDMHGNVWEWCADWYGPYASGAQTDPRGASSGDGRVLRGGSWRVSPLDCRSAARLRNWPDYRRHGLGVRVAVGT
jgi:formylglycine-generating enzyme required for sulfatase activity